MTTKWTNIMIFVCTALATVVSLFFIILYFHRDRHWTPDRFGGLPVALACIPACLISYGISSYCVYKWLRPKLFPRLRAAFPAPKRTDD